MHEAYVSTQLLKLPGTLTIESFASSGDNFFVGTKEGTLLMYRLTKGKEPPVQLIKSNKAFSKKPIVQLDVVQENSILVALKEGIISVHDIDDAVNNFPLISSVQRSKGCSSFTLNVNRVATQSGEITVTVLLCVVMKRKLQFYYWKNRKFHELGEDTSLNDSPKSLAWGLNSLCIGTKLEYSLLRPDDNTKQVQDLFPTGKNQEPRVTLLQDNRFALDKDDQTIFISSSGKPSPRPVQWSEVVQDMVHDQPYLIAVLSKSVEVRTDEPKLLIQQIELPKPKFVSWGSQGRVYIASTNLVWTLSMVSVAEQVPQLLRDKQFELALNLADKCDNSMSDKSNRIQHIKTLMAFDLFCNYKFKDSMDVFFNLDICPSHVIGLISGLLPADFQDKLKYPDNPPVLQGREMENGLLSLIEYITKAKQRIRKDPTATVLHPNPLVEGVEVITSKDLALEILDTTLLKCYLQVNDALVAVLLRFKDNCCNMEETERVLQKSQKINELVIFYKTRKLHQKALELLRSHSSNPDSPLSGHEATVKYLQELGGDHIDLILDFSTWVILNSPEDGLTIFTEDLETVENLPRTKVLEWLRKNSPELVIPYLEHLIHVWEDTNSLFHNNLLLKYKDVILESNNSDEITKRKLNKLLREEPVHYNAEVVLADGNFPSDCLFEERATLLGHGGRHKEALVIYIMILGDMEMAKKYCSVGSGSGSPEVYQELVTMLVKEADLSLLPPNVSMSSNIQLPDMETAVAILEEHWQNVDIAKIVACLPSSASLFTLAKCLDSAIESRVIARHNIQLSKALQRSTKLQLEEQRILQESVKIELTELAVCDYCQKKFTAPPAFVRTVDGRLLHYGCAKILKLI